MLERWTEIAGLLAALGWSLGGLIYSRLPASAGAINLGKNTIATVILFGLILVQGTGRTPLGDLALEPFLWLAGSAVMGILIGDASYLRSLQVLGPRRAMVLSILSPVFSGVIGWFFLAEVLGAGQLLGIAVTLVGVAVVIRERSPEGLGIATDAPRAEGLLHGLNAPICQAVGAAMSKQGMVDIAPLEASFVRLSVAMVGGVLIALASRRLGRWLREIRTPGIPGRITLASFMGTVMGIWLSLVAIQALPVAIATTQTSTAPIFMTVLVAIVLKERVSLRAWGGTLLAIVGVAALIFATAPAPA